MSLLIANWHAPANVHAITTTRDSGNLALHVEDDPQHVLVNRHALKQSLSLPQEPAWLEQTHSNRCVNVDTDPSRDADAAITRQQGQPLVIMTADCLPIILCNKDGNEIAAIHAGWRGLASGIVENTLAQLSSPATSIQAWLGPAICQSCFEIGEDVRHAYLSRYPYTSSAFYQKGKQLFANLPKLAELILLELGISTVSHSAACTFEQEDQFYSYRKTSQTGRIATLIWFL